MSREWSRESYEKSVTSRAWGSTPYDAGWDESGKYGEDLPASAELRAIFEEEMAVGSVPVWAREIVERMIGPLPMCGHYAFPRPLLQVCEAIGRQKCPDFVLGCYTAEAERKLLMSYYVYCLDAWLKGAPLEVAQAELALRDDLGKDWPAIVEAVFRALGEPSEPRTLAIRRLVHRLRWWIKTLVWADDQRDRFLLDVYAGDVRGDGVKWSFYGNPPYGDPYFAERELPEITALDQQIRESVPDGARLLGRIESTWLCAPKAFRYLEKLIVQIGGIGSERPPDPDVPILECADTYPDVASYRKWYSSFMAALAAWLGGDAKAMALLDGITPVGHWLVRTFRHKLELYEKHDPFGSLVGARASGKPGSKTIA